MNKETTKVFRAIFQAITLFAITITIVKDIWGVGGVVIMSIFGAFYVIKDYNEESK
jgi:hypothetical protein